MSQQLTGRLPLPRPPIADFRGSLDWPQFDVGGPQTGRQKQTAASLVRVARYEPPVTRRQPVRNGPLGTGEQPFARVGERSKPAASRAPTVGQPYQTASPSAGGMALRMAVSQPNGQPPTAQMVAGPGATTLVVKQRNLDSIARRGSGEIVRRSHVYRPNRDGGRRGSASSC